MLPDADKPDFESMPQDELIRWLDKLAKNPPLDAGTRDDAADIGSHAALDEAWQSWLNDGELEAETPPIQAPAPVAAEIIEEDDDETPTALSALDESVSDDTTDPLTWRDDKPAEAIPEALDAAARDLGGIARAAELEDPLEWLESLALELEEESAGDETDSVDDDALESDAVEDEDESLFSGQFSEAGVLPEALPDLSGDADEYSTQSMPPVPDFLLAQEEGSPAEPDMEVRRETKAGRIDQLTGAMLLDERLAELEAWYAERLRALEAHDALESPVVAATPPMTPPPGLAAGFNSARGKVAVGALTEALSEYAALLDANIGLDLVISDMQWLLAQADYQDEPAVHRVLGDAMMRRGRLQEALDVYRRAMALLESTR